ncbi:hypothetical protein PROVRUST_07208 [Providencia rustigianii DSM 4541]|uniref:Uncharacterized protein n=1 Tax=Providencia rustigianii DSM 4541 TaxID=500637 RepID=D1P4Q6_9GAMM|nr:hypothetical protein PROVRUST_07208 [Providencia rustigianii DSM 4541]
MREAEFPIEPLEDKLGLSEGIAVLIPLLDGELGTVLDADCWLEPPSFTLEIGAAG